MIPTGIQSPFNGKPSNDNNGDSASPLDQRIGEDLLQQITKDLFAQLAAFASPKARMAGNAHAASSTLADARYRVLVEQLPAVTFMAQLDGSLSEMFVSPQIEDLLGYSAREWLDEPFLWYQRIHPDDKERWTEQFGRTCFLGEPFIAEYRFLARDERTVWVHAEAKLVADDRGAPTFLHGVAYDITARREAEEVLQRSHDELEKLVSERTAALASANQALMVQLAEQRRLEQELRQSQKMEAVGRLAGGVAHDFNNMLTVITGYSEIVLDSLGDKDPLREAVREIKKAGERASALTRQLLAFGRKQVLLPRVLNLNNLVTDMSRMLMRLINEDIDLTTELQSGPWTVRADPGQIEQVILNLVINARDAMSRGGKLVVRTANVEVGEADVRRCRGLERGPHVLLAVSDTGDGMDDQVQAHLFEPFFTTKDMGKGTGLGLPTVYGIVKQSGGSIHVESKIGRGTTFSIYFPRVEKLEARPDLELRVADVPGGKETILLVEDEAGVRGLGSHALRSLGYRVLEAGHGVEALALSERFEGEIHLLLTDAVMPYMGGRELADLLMPVRPGLKVLVVSGYTDGVPVNLGLHSQDVAFLHKPFTPQQLARRVRGLLDGPADQSPLRNGSNGFHDFRIDQDACVPV